MLKLLKKVLNINSYTGKQLGCLVFFIVMCAVLLTLFHPDSAYYFCTDNSSYLCEK